MGLRDNSSTKELDTRISNKIHKFGLFIIIRSKRRRKMFAEAAPLQFHAIIRGAARHSDPVSWVRHIQTRRLLEWWKLIGLVQVRLLSQLLRLAIPLGLGSLGLAQKPSLLILLGYPLVGHRLGLTLTLYLILPRLKIMGCPLPN